MKKSISKSAFLSIFFVMFCLFTTVVGCSSKTNKTDSQSSSSQVGDEYETAILNDEEIRISKYIGTTIDTKLVIPEYIKNRKVVGIDHDCFAIRTRGNPHITSITISKYIKTIDARAFYNSPNITEIIIAGGSELTTIESEAFSKMPNLKKLRLPDSVNYISYNAFTESGITSFEINDNPNYRWAGDLLIATPPLDARKEAMYANPEKENFVVPDDVEILATNLFENNKTIKSIDLKNVETIGANAFKNSSLETIIGGDKVKSLGISAVENTPWLESQMENGGYIILGQSLIKYLGEEKDVIIPENVTSISSNCFENSVTETIVISENVEKIGNNAFYECSKLKWILFPHLYNLPTLGTDFVKKTVSIYVRDSQYNTFSNNIVYSTIKNQLKVKEVTVTFKNAAGEVVGTTTEKYGSVFDEFIEPGTQSGAQFVCWEDEDGNRYTKNAMFEAYNDVTLTPIYE